MEQTKNIHRIIRVNQAGEYGATRIYQGQLAVLKKDKNIKKMADQEAEHLKQFNQLLIENKVRPTLLQPIWHIGGYALGVVTALLGEKTAHACTIAVETVIDEHYKSQLCELDTWDGHEDLKKIIHHCHEEELEHKAFAIDEGGTNAPGFPILNSAIQAISKAAIWLSSRI
ncbi:MAG: demethoxyubiquinone hydroxylase family protein [Alphaproteobacteria bacterium]|jgi:3-demethoxyubiquinol 3-hydroxylase|nr:demethoxyubiquinone hydroxylase family protein [Alphaproteobacteria bacterium]